MNPPEPSIKNALAEILRCGWPSDGEHTFTLLFTDDEPRHRDGAAAYDERPQDKVIRLTIVEGQIIAEEHP